MFERYTEKARRTIFFSRYEASQFGSPQIETEHLLLGLLREDKGIAHRFLPSHDAVVSIRKQIENVTTIREKITTSVDLPLSSECKRILTLAADEADQAGDKWIGTGQLFLGILREGESFAARLLSERGVELEKTRVRLREAPQEPVASPRRTPGVPAGYGTGRLLYNQAAETLILELHRYRTPELLPTRLFMRHKDAEAYDPIGNPPEDVCYESPVTCEKHPVVVFNSLDINRQKGARNWAATLSFNLKTKTIERCFSRDDLRFSEPHRRIWMAELVSLSEDALSVCAKVAIEKEVPGGAVVHYYLAEIIFADREVKPLSRLLDLTF